MIRTAVVVTLIAAGAASAGAQQRSRGLSSPAAPTAGALCPAIPMPPAPSAEQRRAARDLAQRAQQAAILGDGVSAREQLRQAAALDPRDPDLAYQLARANDAAGAAADAASEYCRFLALAPDGAEAAEARERVAVLSPAQTPAVRAPMPRVARFSPRRALSLGLVIPGAGQFYTGRPVAGALAFATAGVAAACAMSQHTTFTPVQVTALDPFGNPYTYTTQQQSSSRPCLVPGLATAGAIAVTTAIEAFNHARRTNDEQRLAVDLVPTGRTLALRVTVH